MSFSGFGVDVLQLVCSTLTENLKGLWFPCWTKLQSRAKQVFYCFVIGRFAVRVRVDTIYTSKLEIYIPPAIQRKVVEEFRKLTEGQSNLSCACCEPITVFNSNLSCCFRPCWWQTNSN